MASSSVPPTVWTAAPEQLERRWQKAFRQRFQVLPPGQWRCVGIDIGKYEHVAVMSDGLGQIVAAPMRFGIRESDWQRFCAWIDGLAVGLAVAPVFGMEPTGHYYEPLANALYGRYGDQQVYLIQGTDVARRRADWNQGTFKSDEVDAVIISELLRTGYGRPYRPPEGEYLSLAQLERYRLAREQAATRLKNQIVGHVDRLYPGLVIGDDRMAERYPPLWHDLWAQDTPRRLLELCPDPRLLRAETADSLYQRFRSAGYWMSRPYAAKILTAVRALQLPDAEFAQRRCCFLTRDLTSLAQVEQQIADVEAEMSALLDLTWGRWLRPTGVDPIRLACLVATVGDMAQYRSARQLFGRSGLHSRCSDSGTQQRHGQGERMVKPGDRHLRRQLMRFTLSMLAHYPALRLYREQLRQRGKGKLTANIAVARKLVGIIYTVVSQEVPFDPAYLT